MMKRLIFAVLLLLAPGAFAQTPVAGPTHDLTIDVKRIYQFAAPDVSATLDFDSFAWDAERGGWYEQQTDLSPSEGPTLVTFDLNHNFPGSVDLVADVAFTGDENDLTLTMENEQQTEAYDLVTAGTPETGVTVWSQEPGANSETMTLKAMPGSLSGTQPGTYSYEITYTLVPPIPYP